MRVIGVIDLMGGRAVHARGGIRARYGPVARVGAHAIDGDPLALARVYVEHVGLSELYVADLDAIAASGSGETASSPAPPVHHVVTRDLARIAPLWLDAGISIPDEARRALDAGATRAVVGLETLRSFDDLQVICQVMGGERVAFSLDVRDGQPVVPRLHAGHAESAPRLAARAADAGAGAVIVLDLARVGAATGPDVDLIGRIREAAPAVAIVAAGGVRGPDDLTALTRAGCHVALIATALHDGRLSAQDVARAHASHR